MFQWLRNLVSANKINKDYQHINDKFVLRDSDTKDAKSLEVFHDPCVDECNGVNAIKEEYLNGTQEFAKELHRLKQLCDNPQRYSSGGRLVHTLNYTDDSKLQITQWIDGCLATKVTVKETQQAGATKLR